MKVVKIQGGLGNQLFGVGFAASVARLTGAPVWLDVAAFAASHYGSVFELGELAGRLDLRVTRRPLLSSRVVTALMRHAPARSYVSEGARPPAPPRLEALARRGGYFNGYWQDEAYLAAAAPFRRLAREALLSRSRETPAPGVVVHWRTYCEEIHRARRLTPEPDWLDRCLERLRRAGRPLDDVALISDNLDVALARLGERARGMRVVAGGDQWSDMALMLRARVLVLTNSTYSWWGGFCGEAETILYPARGELSHYAAPAARFTVVD